MTGLQGDESTPPPDATSDEPMRGVNRKLIAVVVVVAILAISVGYYGYSSYEDAVIQTTIMRGTITGFQSSGVPNGANPNTAGATYVSIKTQGNVTFSQLIGCSTTPFHVGTSVRLADQLLRSGQHNYIADIACKNQISEFSSLHLDRSTTTVTTTTTTTSSK